MADDPSAWEYKVLPHVRGWSEATAPDLVALAADLEAYLRQQGALGWELVATLGSLEAAALILKRRADGTARASGEAEATED